MNNQQEISRFEFLLTLENNIICQRFFNVRELNKKSLGSLDIYEYVQDICNDIGRELKKENFLYMTNKQRNYETQTNDEEVGKNENYTVELKYENRVFHTRSFDASCYHPKVRYSVDIRPKMKGVISDLTNILSSKNLNNKYLKYKLG